MPRRKSGTTKATGRDYGREYKEYQGTEEQKKRRAQRNKARRMMEREGRAHKGDGRDTMHLDNNTANNSKSNLRVGSRSANRSEPRHRGTKRRVPKKRSK